MGSSPPLARLKSVYRCWPWLVGLLVLLGLLARCARYLHGPSYWYDEAYLLLNIFSRPGIELFGRLDHEQAAPPLYLLLLRGLYVAFGPSEFVLRLPALLASVLALGLSIPLARRFLGPPAWPWAVSLTAVCHHAVTHGAEVKPYAIDLLASVSVLLLATVALSDIEDRPVSADHPPARVRTTDAVGLCLAALALPWLSYPAVFLLGGVSVALLWHGCRRRDMAALVVWALFTTTLAGSAGVLYEMVVRRQASPYLHTFWAFAFPELLSWKGLLEPFVLLARIGHEGTNGMGPVLMVLSVAGLAMLARESFTRWLLVAAPLLLALAAAALHRYPLAKRLVFFAVPLVWLPAALALGRLASWAANRPGYAALLPALLALLVVPEAVRMTAHLFTPPKASAFREAFEHVHARRRPGDVLWVSHLEVYEVYHGRPEGVIGSHTAAEEVARVARGRRLWLVFTPQKPGMASFADLFAALQKAGCQVEERTRVPGLEIVCYRPAPTPHSPFLGCSTRTSSHCWVRSLPKCTRTGVCAWLRL